MLTQKNDSISHYPTSLFSRYSDKLRSVLKLRHAGDLAYTEEKDLTQIGMSRPEQKRLRQEYLKVYPSPSSSLVVKLRKAFGRDGKSATATNSSDLSISGKFVERLGL